MLFSTTPQTHYFTIGTSGGKSAIDKHHIFPKEYLSTIGYSDDRERNQIANYTYLDYQTNISICDRSPNEYVTDFRTCLGENAYRLTCHQNALPEDFENMEYHEFLAQRRLLMAQIVKKAYAALCI